MVPCTIAQLSVEGVSGRIRRQDRVRRDHVPSPSPHPPVSLDGTPNATATAPASARNRLPTITVPLWTRPPRRLAKARAPPAAPRARRPGSIGVEDEEAELVLGDVDPSKRTRVPSRVSSSAAERARRSHAPAPRRAAGEIGLDEVARHAADATTARTLKTWESLNFAPDSAGRARAPCGSGSPASRRRATGGVSTVRSPRKSAAATSRFVRPSATSAATRCSAGVRPSSRERPPMLPQLGARLSAQPGRRSPRIRRAPPRSPRAPAASGVRDADDAEREERSRPAKRIADRLVRGDRVLEQPDRSRDVASARPRPVPGIGRSPGRPQVSEPPGLRLPFVEQRRPPASRGPARAAPRHGRRDGSRSSSRNRPPAGPRP